MLTIHPQQVDLSLPEKKCSLRLFYCKQSKKNSTYKKKALQHLSELRSQETSSKVFLFRLTITGGIKLFPISLCPYRNHKDRYVNTNRVTRGKIYAETFQLLATQLPALVWFHFRVSLTWGCAPVAVAETAGLPWQQRSEQAGPLCLWRPRDPPPRSSAATL